MVENTFSTIFPLAPLTQQFCLCKNFSLEIAQSLQLVRKLSYLRGSFNFKWVDDLRIITNFTKESF